MKKTAIIIAGAVLLALGSIAVAVSIERNSGSTIFEANVEALANGESGIYGFCEERDNACMGPCPGCGQLVYASGHAGPVKGDLFGTCNH